MAKQIPIEEMQSERDKSHDRYLHYSLVRMAILAFLVPMAGMIMSPPASWLSAGLLFIIVAVALNWIFGYWSLREYLYYDSKHKYLKSQIPPLSTYDDLRVPGNSAGWYIRSMFGTLPVKDLNLGKGWRKMEPIIQFFVFFTIGLFLLFAQQFVPLGWVFVVLGISIAIIALINILRKKSRETQKTEKNSTKA